MKILIEAHLKRKGDIWEDFLIRNHFKEVEQEDPSNKTRKIRRNLPSNPKENSPAQDTQQDQYSDDETPLASVLENLKKKIVRKKIANNKRKVHQKEKRNKKMLKSILRLLKNHHQL